MEELSMFDLRTMFWGSVFRAKQPDRRGVSDDTLTTVPRTVPKSRRDTTVRSRRLSAPIEIKPLSEEDIRNLPVANRFSA